MSKARMGATEPAGPFLSNRSSSGCKWHFGHLQRDMGGPSPGVPGGLWQAESPLPAHQVCDSLYPVSKDK